MTGKICGTGACVPTRVMDNEELASLVDTSDAWIRERTGIARRHVAGEETTALMAASAAKKALKNAGISAEEVEMLIVSTISSDVILPCAACVVQKEIGAANAVCFDLNAACTGFVLAYQTAMAYMAAGICRTALVVGSESLSRLTNWKDRGTCILFGDGAGAAVIKASGGNGYLPVAHSDGRKGSALTCRSRHDGRWEDERKEEYLMQMDGQEVFKFAVRKVPEVIREVLSANRLALEDIDWFIVHQANRRIIETAAKYLGASADKFPMNMEEYGNTSSASIPILLDEMNRDGRLEPGQKIVMAGFGAGLTWGASVIEWK